MWIERFKFPFYVIVHPFKGFWEMKYDKKGHLTVALAIVFLVSLASMFQYQYAGFIVNPHSPYSFNSMIQLRNVILPFFLWCVANWSLTTLMDGEGKFGEIVVASAYALLPIFLLFVPATIYSRFITQEETAFYYYLNGFAIIWFLYLIFVSTMTVHQYTVLKTIVTIGLTVVCMGFIVFLCMLFFSLIQQMYSVYFTIYRELQFR
ncbi:Yip1 family protein [Cohnella sp. REN36]|uniref:Yip1 family protein n=1 Tax=Cohnella sp. REN36 TaxID=2887347 RepID=UPI001D1454D0|nr:Yip1 family protein [Cohnella sp. REN36]MCC3372035.1 YIP1 family protein [Cohnella sp. REN36]